MTTVVSSVLRAMEHIAPLRLAGSWDNVGLILEAPFPNHKRRVLLTIDLTTAVAEEALALEPSLIISYHPPIFSGLKSLTMANPLQASLLRCAAKGISVFAPHTSVDAILGGVNDWLARAFHAGEGVSVRTIRPADPASPVREAQAVEGEGRIVTLQPPRPLDAVVASIKQHLGLSAVQLGRSANGKADVSTIAICAGSGGSVFKGVSADLLWTGELSHHEVLAAVASGSHVLLCGHTNTERGYLKVLKQRLQDELAADQDVEILVSQKDHDPLTIL